MRDSRYWSCADRRVIWSKKIALVIACHSSFARGFRGSLRMVPAMLMHWA